MQFGRIVTLLGTGLCVALAPACGRATLVATAPVRALAGARARLVLLPVDFVLFRDGGRYDPADTVAASRAALGPLRATFGAETRARGGEVIGALSWSGRLLAENGSALGSVTDSARVLATMQSVLAGGGVPADVAETLATRFGASGAVLLTGSGSWTSAGKRAAQAAAATGLALLGVAGAALIVAAAAEGGLTVDVAALPDRRARGTRGPHTDGVVPIGPYALGGLLLHPVPFAGLRLAWDEDVGVPLVSPAAYLGAAHADDDGCLPAASIHDGVPPVPAQSPVFAFWRGSRIDLTLALLPLTGGELAWSAHAERRADARHPRDVRRLMRALLRLGGDRKKSLPAARDPARVRAGARPWG